MGWFNDLGRKTTPSDPDGSRHRIGFLGFVVAMLLLITALIIIQANRAEAVVCRGPISGTHDAAAGSPWVRLTASRWCSNSTNNRFATAPSFSRSYGENLSWSFNKWFTTKSSSGIGTAPNGTRNVEWRAQWVAAEFKFCVSGACLHSHPYGVRIWAWANGNYSVREDSRVPFSPLPRP